MLAAIMCLCGSLALAEEPDGTAPDDFNPDDASFGGTMADLGMTQLTKSDFDADDLPEHYQTPAENQGRVVKINYSTDNNVTMADLFAGGNVPFHTVMMDGTIVKHAMVYLPAGYDESEERYNILYMLHGSSSEPRRYLDPEEVTVFQCILDHMIEDGLIEPLIVVAATYYPQDEMVKVLPLAMKVQAVRTFPDELVEDIIPQVESRVRTWAESTTLEGIVDSRDHRAIAGFSLGGVATWYTFQQQMQAFRWFLPISEAGWDDGDGGLTGILDSSVSARAIYDAVKSQGYGPEDFMLFVATGSDDEAFEITTNQMISLLAYDDMFIVGTNTSCSMMSDGTHTTSAMYTYAYHILPGLFVDAAQ
ncbi:MAG: hypothetical protein IJE07_04325 [Clostridia bacterium]|nr:hypothetical protein [Clostridia bacterium]